MGNKSKLLDFVIPRIESVTKPGDTICDIMAGTNSIGYACKNRNRIISNDIQMYSYVIANCLLKCKHIPTQEEARKDLEYNIQYNDKHKEFNFFYDNYSDTYFSDRQCQQIDSIRYAIEQCEEEKKYFYLTILMSVMCKAQSTPGHFAQYMDMHNARIIPIRKYDVEKLFFDKIVEFKDYDYSDNDNECYNLDYNELLNLECCKDVTCFYLDSPYTHDQYSRFYHVLETICKYDNPTLSFKAKYRDDRIQSKFCYNKTVEMEFDNIIGKCHELGAAMVISYSNHGVIEVEKLAEIARKHYKNVKLEALNYDHSSQGKGTIEIKEVVLTLKN